MLYLMKELTSDQVFETIDKGEFPDDVIGQEKAAVIMTESWCPQWKAMESWLGEIDFPVYIIVYDGKEYHEDFRKFKEKEFGTDEFPYVRYYKCGKLIAESHYVNKGVFEANFD